MDCYVPSMSARVKKERAYCDKGILFINASNTLHICLRHDCICCDTVEQVIVSVKWIKEKQII